MPSPATVGLFDTDVVILLRYLDREHLPAEAFISAVTLAELSVGPLVAKDAKVRTDRQSHLQEVEAAFDPLPFDAAAARAFGRVAASLRSAGRNTTARAFDALIAATAIANGLSLYTCNPDDYLGIAELDVIAAPRSA